MTDEYVYVQYGHLIMKYDIKRCERQLAILGKSQADIARDLDTYRSLVNKFFQGLGVTNETAKRIIEALDLKVEDVLLPESNGRKSA